MFSFHKPKIYRSNLGCCICKAKSSSSRFTDSKKYENEFERCFRIQEKRSGEICNACVLLVKRWKKLSPENRLTKHWHHVVDARAGPGTKLTGNRRLVGSSSSSSSQDSSSNCQAKQRPSTGSARSEVLPLSSNQINNQSTSSSANNSSAGQKRASSFSIKARAIDTNVTTFTFGEPNRRSYMTPEAGYSATSFSSMAKPQSALNSSAFETVIKRFRQRQQQQQLEAQRRLLNRQQRLQQQSQPQSSKTPEQQLSKTVNGGKKRSLAETGEEMRDIDRLEQQQAEQQASAPSKRLKRSSESIGSLSIDGLRVSSLLDNTIWRKEKVCCGTIFRSCFDEVAVFPKLLKPCQCKVNSFKQQFENSLNNTNGQEQLLITQIDRSPPPRATKSGSISSCDSNTSGTGSMEQPLEELHEQNKHRIQRRKSNLRSIDSEQMTVTENLPTAMVLGEKQQQQSSARGSCRPRSTKRQQVAANRKLCADTESTISNSSSLNSSRAGAVAASTRSGSDSIGQQVHSPAASSASSSGSSRLLLMADEEDDVDDDEEDDDDDDELIMDEDEDVESNTDGASSSIESLTGVESKKSGFVGAMG